jgi:ABC-type transport system involved in multi-copper enzyme maturation permease subunit
MSAAADTRPTLTRLTVVELRKMTDTRAGFWLQLSVVGLAVLVVVINALAGHASDHQFMDYFSGTSQGISALLPVLGILLVTSEWSQRTAMITFTLVPQRARVVGAKVLAAVALALVALVVALLLAVIGTALTDPGIGRTWRLPPGALGQVALYLTATMLIGVAFGAVLLNSAPAIVLYYLVPIGFGALGAIHALDKPMLWIDQSRAMEHITDRFLSGSEWAHVGTSLALWILVPLVVGLGRIQRSEIR